MKAIRLLIVDDHEVVRAGLRSVFERVSGFEVVDLACDGKVALQLVAEKLPDVVLMDVRMPVLGGVEACRIIRERYPQIRVMMLSCYGDEEALVSSLLAGACGYVLKEIGCSDLIQSVRVVAAGGFWLDRAATGRVWERLRGGTDAAVEPHNVVFTQRERDILSLIAAGKTNKEIAGTVGLSEKTVRNYVSGLLAKLKVSNRAGAAAHAVRENLVD